MTHTRMVSEPRKADVLLFGIVLALLLIGLFMIASASPVLASTRFGDPYFFLKNQLGGVVVGLIVLLMCWRIPYTYWRVSAPLLLGGAMIFMMLVFVPGIGLSLKGAARWLDFGITTIQPAEIMKFAFIAYLSAWIAAKQPVISSTTTGFLPFSALVGIVSFLFVLQPDIGTLGVVVTTSFILFFIGGGRFFHIAALVASSLLILAVLVFLQPYRLDRVTVFLHPEDDQQGIGYQLNQSLIAIGSGGVVGRGFGMSRQKLNYLPEASSDALFSIYAEEFGFLGSCMLIALFLLFFWRGIRIAARAPDAFGMYLASGITLLIVIQAFINIAALSGLMPLTGLPLSFVSFGSSALVMNLAEAGTLLNISASRTPTRI